MIKGIRITLSNQVGIISDEGTFCAEFPFDVHEVFLWHNKLLVRTQVPKGEKFNRNIFCLNEKGEILWQIQDPDERNSVVKKTDSPFVGIYTKKEALRVANWNSYDYDVDLNTGNISNAEFSK